MNPNNTRKIIIRCLICHKLKSGYRGKISKFCSEKCSQIYHRGKNSWNWKGGRQKHTGGYIEITKPEHPNSDKRGRILEHRFIMSQKLRRPLKKREVVHHINGKRNDNRPNNLKICQSAGYHIAKEHPNIMKKFQQASPKTGRPKKN